MKRGTTGHPKTKALARNLGVSLPTAIGTLQLLWEFASEYAPDGAVGKFSDGYIAEECGWDGNPADLVAALTAPESRWVDTDGLFRLIVHDWPDHCEDSVHNKLARSRKFFADGSAPKLSRLGREERKDADLFYKEFPVASARHAIESARDERTEHALKSARDVQLKAHVAGAPTLPIPTLPIPATTTASGGGGVSEMPRISEFPKTDAAIRRRYAAAGLPMVMSVVHAAQQAYLNVECPRMPPPTDQDFADAVEEAAKTSYQQQGPGLFKTTVPAVIKSWAQLGRHPPEKLQGTIYKTGDYDSDGNWVEGRL